MLFYYLEPNTSRNGIGRYSTVTVFATPSMHSRLSIISRAKEEAIVFHFYRELFGCTVLSQHWTVWYVASVLCATESFRRALHLASRQAFTFFSEALAHKTYIEFVKVDFAPPTLHVLCDKRWPLVSAMNYYFHLYGHFLHFTGTHTWNVISTWTLDRCRWRAHTHIRVISQNAQVVWSALMDLST